MMYNILCNVAKPGHRLDVPIDIARLFWHSYDEDNVDIRRSRL